MKTIHEIQACSEFQTQSPEIFEKTDDFLNLNALFLANFKTIPNEINLKEIEVKEANIWFLENYNSLIKDVFFKKTDSNSDFSIIIFMLFEDLLIEFDAQHSTIKLVFRKTNYDAILELISQLEIFTIWPDKLKSKINILISEHGWIGLMSILIKPKSFVLNENYNSDFIEIHQNILVKLSEFDNKGIVLFHGLPGTGKTNYLRYLISILPKKTIFLPPNMAEHLTNPQLTNLLMANPNSIFIIEDAEKIITSRDLVTDSGISTLLNISDGLLSDFLNIQIICTFNTPISMVDKALLRKGRLIAKYEFKELELEKTRQLSKKLGFKNEILQPMTLAEIYNQAEPNFITPNPLKPIGFN